MKDQEGRWIKFHLKASKAKTKVFEVKAKEDDMVVGEIQWFAGWRTYAFFPANDTVFELTCLDDITNFISRLMRERYNIKLKEKHNAEHFIKSPKQLQLDIGKILQLKKIISVNDQKLDYYARK